MSGRIPRRITAACLVLAIAVSGCSKKDRGIQQEGQQKTTISVRKEFQEHMEEIFRENVSDNGIELHYTLKNPEKYGIQEKSQDLGTISASGIAEGKKETEQELKAIRRFPYEKLSEEQQETYDVWKDYLTIQKELQKYPYHESVLAPVTGVQAQLPVTFCEYRLETKEDVENYFHLLSQTGDYFESIIEYEKEKVKKNLFMSDESADAVISQIHEFTKAKANNSLIATFEDRISSVKNLTSSEQKEKIKKNRSIVLDQVLPAYEKLADDLENLKGNGKNEAGLVYLKDGKSYYKALVKSQTGSSSTIEDMIAMTEDSLKDCVLKTADIAEEFPEALQESAGDNLPDDLGTTPDDMLAELKKQIEKNFPKAPKVDCEIKYVHESLEKDLSPAFYMIPAMDDYKENVIYINRSQMDTSIQMYATLAHEGYPGHLYQNVYYASKEEEPVRYILDYPGYSEGWATYVESWSYTAAGGGKEKEAWEQLNVLGMEFNLALCSRVDFGVNYEGWKKEKVKDYLKQFYISSSNAEHIFSMVVSEPANYLSYYIGYKEFIKLRDYYKKGAGKKYSLKKFHKLMLDAGPTSFNILKKRINENLRMEE